MITYPHITPAMRRHIRKLDIAWAMEWARKQDGRGFYASYSDVTGMSTPAEFAALSFLHQLRVAVGSKTERKHSVAWLAEHRQTQIAGDPS